LKRTQAFYVFLQAFLLPPERNRQREPEVRQIFFGSSQEIV